MPRKNSIDFKEQFAEAYQFFARCGRKGGSARAHNLTKEEKTAHSLHANAVRWARYRAEQKQAKQEAQP